VGAIDAEALGLAAVTLGAGRQVKGEAIDPAVGFMLRRKIGDPVRRGEALLDIHARTPDRAAQVRDAVAAAFVVQATAPAAPPLILGVV
jgi:pyrimidine-nucleoside phosphorylase